MNPPILRALVAAALLAAGSALVPTGAAAQLPPILGPTTTTTGPGSTTSGPAPSSTTTTAPPLFGTTSSTTPPPPTSVPPPATEPAEPPLPSGDGAPPLQEAITRGTIPPWALDQINSVARSRANNTRRLLERLKPLEAFGFTAQEAAIIGLGRFPIAGEASFGDDWWYPRFAPEFHLHEGTDVFAAFGAPVIAPFDGVVTMGEGRVGGLYTYLTVEDGTYYYFAHLDKLPTLAPETQIAEPEVVARYTFREFDQPVAYRVEAGTIIGTVGDTGNAKGGTPHLHFEVHPQGGEAVNPKPVLDQWLSEAEAALDDVIALYTSRGPKAVISTQRTRAGGTGQFSAPKRPLAAEILGVSSVGPSTGVQVVTEEVARAVARIDWDRYRRGLAGPMERLHASLSSAFARRGD